MTRKIGAIIFIFFCTSVAWLILGTTIFARTYELSVASSSRVASTWGTQQNQGPPTAAYITQITKNQEVVENGKTVKKTWTEAHRIHNDLALFNRVSSECFNRAATCPSGQLAIVLLVFGWLGIVPRADLALLEHGLMMPVMLIPMLLRLDLYTGRRGHTMRVLRMGRAMPAGALRESVGPITSRYRATAFSPSRTMTTAGPEVMKRTRSLKNGRSLWTA